MSGARGGVPGTAVGSVLLDGTGSDLFAGVGPLVLKGTCPLGFIPPLTWFSDSSNYVSL